MHRKKSMSVCVTFKPRTHNKRDNRSRIAIPKENNGIYMYVCQDEELNKGGPCLEAITQLSVSVQLLAKVYNSTYIAISDICLTKNSRAPQCDLYYTQGAISKRC